MNFNPFTRFRAAALAFCALWLGTMPAQAAYTSNGDGTVTDSATGLVWDQCAYGLSGSACDIGTAGGYTWQDALKLAVSANTANYKGHKDWRLPSIKELESLVKIDVFSPAIDATVFPNASFGFWSSSVLAPNSAYAWAVHFNGGAVSALGPGNAYQVRLARGGQSFDRLKPYRVGGTLSGLAASASVVLQNNSGDDLTMSANGAFSFATGLGTADTYAVTVRTQPANPPQACTVGNDSGTVGTADVSNVAVNCVTYAYAVTGIASPAGAGSVNCPPNPVTHGQSVSCTVSTSSDYILDGSSSDTCGGSLSGSTYTTGPVTAACTVTVQFLAIQTITNFTATPANPVYAPGGSFTVSATGGGSGNPVTFATNSTSCSVVGNVVTMLAAGICTLTADQGGSTGYAAAAPAALSVTIAKAVQTLTFGAQTPASHTFAQGGTFTIAPLATSASPNSGQPITYSSLSAGVCTVSGTEVIMVSAGTCTITADQAGDDKDYAAAAQVTQTVALNVVTPIPTLGQWSLMLLALLAAGLGARGLRRA